MKKRQYRSNQGRTPEQTESSYKIMGVGLVGIIIAMFFMFLTSCAVNPLRDIDTYGLTYDGTDVYCDGVRCAELSAVEIAYDNGKIVTEATFVLVDAKYNDRALSIIKFVRDRKPGYEVEVELKNQN